MDKQLQILELTTKLLNDFHSILVKHVPSKDWIFSLLNSYELTTTLEKSIKQHIENLPKILSSKVDPTDMLIVALKDLRTGVINLGDFEISLHNKVDNKK